MKYSLELSRERSANVWFDEFPPASFDASSTVTRILSPKVVLETSWRIAVVEINIHLGGMISYALLGAEIVETGVDEGGCGWMASKCSSRPIPADGNTHLPSQQLRNIYVTIGLTSEYVSTVFEGVERIVNSVGAPKKVSLRFRWAANGSVGSSPWIFEKIGGWVLQMLMLKRDFSEQELAAVFG